MCPYLFGHFLILSFFRVFRFRASALVLGTFGPTVCSFLFGCNIYNISLHSKLKTLSDDVIRLLKMTKTFSTMAEKRDQPELLRTINLAVTLHSGTATPLDIINICVVRPMLP